MAAPSGYARFHSLFCQTFVFVSTLATLTCGLSDVKVGKLPIFLNTWPFTAATMKGWDVLFRENGSALDAIEQGGSVCEQFGMCATSIGYGADPDEIGETTLDAMIMDGVTHDVGAVGDLRRVKTAISVARAVLKYTTHTLLAGESATNFAAEMGFQVSDLHTNFSAHQYQSWKQNNCQPNYRQNVSPDPKKVCGPYKPLKPKGAHKTDEKSPRFSQDISEDNHDTIGLLAIDADGIIAGGVTTNGLNHKVPGRVGDSPIAGAGVYVDRDVGGAAGTGDGDVMMRFLPSFQTVSYMEQGMKPGDAAELSIRRIMKYYPDFSGALIAVNILGDHGGACRGFSTFPYSVQSQLMTNATVFNVTCISAIRGASNLHEHVCDAH